MGEAEELRQRATWYREWAKLAGHPDERAGRNRLAEHCERKAEELENAAKRDLTGDSPAHEETSTEGGTKSQ